MRDRLLPKRMCSGPRDLFQFREISNNISETAQDGGIVHRKYTTPPNVKTSQLSNRLDSRGRK